jgi:ribosomal protein S18 acetylase RimI-like enzyme
MPTFREASEADLESICTIGGEVNAIHHRVFPHIFAGPGLPGRDREHWASSIGGSSSTTFVAEDRGRVVGFVTVSVATESHSLLQPLRYGRVGSVGVVADCRGRGIGPQLMKLAENWVLQNGGREVRLNVWAFNAHALHMYEELGYEVRSHFLAKRVDAGDA